MTTAAWDGEVLAVDRQCTSGNVKSPTNKLIYNEKWAYAMVGRLEACHRFWNALIRDATILNLGVEGCHGIVVHRPTKRAYTVEGSAGVLLSCRKSDFVAAGSGRDFAIAAMHLELSAVHAVRLASKYDLYTGMGVSSIKP